MPTNNLDFSKMMFNVVDVPQGTDLCHKFPKLGSIKEFQSYPHADRNYVIRYVLLMYDKGTPLIENYEELSTRKQAAADIAGWERKKSGEFKSEKIYEVMELKDEDVNNMIFALLKDQNNRTWTQIVNDEQIFDEYSRLLMEPVAGKDSKNILDAANVKAKLREERKAIAADLQKFYKELFKDNTDLQEEAEKVKPITPETISQHFNKKQ